MKHRSEAYLEYVRSEAWAEKKRAFRTSKLCKNRCAACGKAGRLEIHHKSYKRLGRERLADLVELCRVCHAATHEVVAASTNRSKTNHWNGHKKLRRRADKSR